MRDQPGPCLALGNYPAARRYVRNRKPPPIILWTIGIITCLLLIGSAVMLTVGYLNPFGTVGLAILGVGAVVYFGAIIFLVLSCLWVERKYPGMQPLSFKIYSRKPNRIPPTTFTNPHMSGQMPADTTPSYRMHNELPGIINVGGKTDTIPSTPNDKSQEKKDNTTPSHEKNPKIQSTALNVLQEEDHNGGKDDSPDIRLQALTNTDNITMNKDSPVGLEEKSHPQPEQNTYGEGAENDSNVSASLKRERKVKLKTHHIEVPFEDYPSSDSSISLSNKKDKPKDIQKPKPKDNSQLINNTTENDNLPTTGASKSTAPTKPSAMGEQKEASSSVNNLSHARDAHPHQRTKEAAHSTDKDIKQETSNLSNTQKSGFIEKGGTLQDGLQPPSSFQPTIHTRKPMLEKHQNNQDSSQMVSNLPPTISASPLAVGKSIEHESYASKPANSAQKDSAIKASPVSDRKLTDVHKHNATTPDQAQGSVQEKSQISSFLNVGKNALLHSNNLRHEHQNMATSPKHRTQNVQSQGGSPTCAQKMQSPDRARKVRRENAVPNSPPINRKVDGSSPPKHHQKRPDNLSEAQRTKEQSITIQTFSSSGRKEEIQKKKILHSSTSSQSSDLPSSSSSSSSPRQHQRSPNRSPRLPRNGDHTSRTTTVQSTSRNEDFSNRKSRHSSPSSDVTSSPSSSPQRTHRKSPDLSTKMQRHKDIPVKNVVSLSSNKKDEPSSQSTGVLSSPSGSPLTAKKLLQNKKEQTNQYNQTKSVPQPRTNK